MMKKVVIWVALCISFAQAVAVQNVPGFEDGKRYVYKYQMRMATGITEGDVKQFSAFGTRFKMSVENHEGQLLIQYYDFEFGIFNDKINNIFDELPMAYISPPESMPLAQEFKVPFAVSLENEVIKSFEFSENERMEIINVKKAIALLLQLKLTPPEGKDEHFYTVYEDGIGGDCLTAYNIVHDPPENTPDIQVLNVTKVRFYDKCKKRPHLFHINVEGSKQLETKFEPLQELAQSEYQIRGNRQKYTIESVVSNGAVVLTPFTTNGQSILSVVNQTLTLVDIEDGLKLAKPEKTVTDEKLNFVFVADARDHENVDLKEAHLSQLVNHFNFKEKSDELVKLLPELVKSFKERKNGAKLVGKIISFLRTLDYDTILNFYEKHVYNIENDGAKTIKGIFNEALPYVGSNPSILFVFHLIETKQIDISIANRWLQKLPFNVKEPSQKLLAKFKELIESEPITKYTKLVNSGWLAYGSLIKKGCEENLFNPHPSNAKHYIKAEICEHLVKELLEKFNKANTQTEQGVYIRAIKNTHSPFATKLVLNVALGGYPLLIRLEGVTALASQEPHAREEIMAANVQILSNKHEHSQLRMLAFDNLIFDHYGPPQFSVLLQKLQKEPSQKLASYIYTTLEALANGSYECPDKLAMRSRYLLQFLDKPKYDVLRHSFIKEFTSFNANYQFGRSSKLVLVPSNTSAVPRELFLEQTFTVMGYNFRLLGLGYISEGNNVFEYTLLNALQPEGLSPGKSKDGEPTPEHLKYVIENLKLQEAIKDEIKDYEVYCSVFGQDVYYSRAFGFEDGPRFGGPDVTYNGETAHIDMNSILYVDARLVVPNEIGVPVYIKLQIPITYQVLGSAKVAPQLTSTDNQVSLSKRLQGIIGEFDIKLISDVNVNFEMYAENLIGETYGYNLNTHFGLKLPIKGGVDYDFKTKKLDIKYIPSSEIYDLIDYESRPVTFINQNLKDVHFINKPVNKIYSTDHHYFGLGLTLNFTYDYLWNDYGSYRTFLKSFFNKPCSNEDYHYLSDKLYAGVRGFIDYALLNPTAKPFKFNVRYQRCSTHPASEFSITSKCTSAHNTEEESLITSKKWVLDVVGKGTVDRTWKIEFFTNSRYPYEDKRHTTFRFRRLSAPGWYDDPFEICYNGDLDFENYITISTPEPKDPKVKYNGHFLFGDRCKIENPNFIIKSVWEKSEEHELVNRTENLFYKKCREDTKIGFFSEACWEMIKDIARITKFSFDIEHNNIPVEIKKYLYRIYLFSRHYFYNNLQIEPFKGTTEEGHTKIIANVSYYHPIADVHIYRHDETVHYHNIYIPSIFPKYEPYTVAESLSERLARMLFNYNPPFCYISAQHVFTLDGVHYQHKLGDCYYLLFADCLHHTVNILLKDIKHDKFNKTMRVFLGHTLIDVVPGDDELIVKVNDEVKIVTSGQIYEHISQDTGKSLFVISLYSPGIYISAKSYSIELYFDGAIAFVQASNFYRGRHCGLCGNFDGENKIEYVGPTGVLYKNAADFAKSYAVKENGCTVK